MGVIPFELVTTLQQRAITMDLAALEQSAVATNETVETLIWQRADYFWQQNLAMDAWQELVAIAPASPRITQMLEDSAICLCEN